MDLWIRSQDKMTLSIARDLRLFELNKKWCIVVIWNNDREQMIYAKYSTKEKALKVLDEVQDSMYDIYETTGRDGNVLVRTTRPTQDNFVVYQMPQDNEVEA